MTVEQICVRIRPAQIVVLALAMGMMAFAGVTIVLVRGGHPPAMAGDVAVIRNVARGLVFLGVVLGWLLWKGSCRQARRRVEGLDENDALDALLPIFQTGLITRAALLEGPGLFCIVTALLSGELWMLAWGAASIAGLVAIFPTTGTYLRFVQDARGAAGVR
ncbi:MAG: hypothetical protein U0637_12640 [Phycisphaerales bacterium]